MKRISKQVIHKENYCKRISFSKINLSIFILMYIDLMTGYRYLITMLKYSISPKNI
jgi:hypothetical protein